MRFKKLDLNLLVALDALLTERNITRAAEKLHLTQSAMSNALARLREYFEDDLLTPVGRRMEPTARARILETSVKHLLTQIDATLYATPAFDPALSQREFSLFLSDFSMLTLLPTMQTLAAQQRSQVRFRLKPQLGDLTQLLERSQLDLLIAPLPFCSRAHPVQELFEIEYVCVMWQDSSLAQTPLTHEVYRDALHAVRLMPDDNVHTAFHAWFLERYGIACRVGLSTYSYMLLPLLVVGTEMIATVPQQIAQLIQQTSAVVIKPLPDPALKLIQCMQWHQQRTDDPGLVWLRQLVLQASQLIKPRALTG